MLTELFIQGIGAKYVSTYVEYPVVAQSSCGSLANHVIYSKYLFSFVIILAG